MKVRSLLVMLVLALMAVAAVPSATAATSIDSSALRSAVTVDGVRAHQSELQTIANNNNHTRVAGSNGHVDSATYVYNKLRDAGYKVAYQPFTFILFTELAPSVLEQTTPNPKSYVNGVDQQIMEYSGSGNVTASVQAVDLLLPPKGGSTSGCESADFNGFTAGKIALIQRGTCNFIVKAQNAQAAGAAGVIIFNEGNTPDRQGLIIGTLGEPVNIPVVETTFAVGVELNSLISSGLQLHLQTSTSNQTRQTKNVIAETPGGRADRVVVVGAHLDSVDAGPGINDNGSGSAVDLEIALQMAKLNIQPVNKVRFAFWSAEEQGLVGSQYYVDHLSAREIKNIAVNLNFDMVGSPNFVRFVYDGNGSDSDNAGPNGSKAVEDIFLEYFASQGLQTEPTAFDGRSDYGPFIDVGIPAGGLFTGAEEIKSVAEAAIYGGQAGVAYDPCYHQACDTYTNNNDTALDQMSDAAAHAVLSLALTTSAVNGTDKGSGGQYKNKLDYDGPFAQR